MVDWYVDPPKGLSYGAARPPDISGMMMKGPGSVVDSYMEARANAPVLDPVTGQPSTDPQVILKELLSRPGGGRYAAQYMQGIMPYWYGSQLSAEDAKALKRLSTEPGEETPETPRAAPASPWGAAPGHIVPGAGATVAPGRTIAGMAAGLAKEGIIDPSEVGAAVTRVASALKVGRTDPLDNDTLEKANALMLKPGPRPSAADEHPPVVASPEDARSVTGRGVSGAPGTAPSTAPETAAPASGIEPGGGPLPRMAGATPPVPSALTPGPAVPRAAPPAAAPTPPPSPGGPLATPPPAAGPVQVGLPGDSMARVKALRARADEARAEGARRNIGPAGASRMAPFAATAADLDKRADAMEERLKPQGPQQQAILEGFPTETARQLYMEQQKGVQKASDTKVAGINAAADQYRQEMRPALETAKNILNQPGMWTGAGANLLATLNRGLQAFGFGSQDLATLQEAFKKITAISVLGQLNNQRFELEAGGEKAARIFQQQVQLVGQSSPEITNSKSGNRFLVEFSDRMGKLKSTIAHLANEYMERPDPELGGRPHGKLDRGWDEYLANYLDKHPVFTKQEQEHPALLGAPDLPPSRTTPEAINGWFAEMGLQPTDYVRLPNGQYKHAVPLKITVRPAG
jgi:hypothetical protein